MSSLKKIEASVRSARNNTVAPNVNRLALTMTSNEIEDLEKELGLQPIPAAQHRNGLVPNGASIILNVDGFYVEIHKRENTNELPD